MCAVHPSTINYHLKKSHILSDCVVFEFDCVIFQSDHVVFIVVITLAPDQATLSKLLPPSQATLLLSLPSVFLLSDQVSSHPLVWSLSHCLLVKSLSLLTLQSSPALTLLALWPSPVLATLTFTFIILNPWSSPPQRCVTTRSTLPSWPVLSSHLVNCVFHLSIQEPVRLLLYGSHPKEPHHNKPQLLKSITASSQMMQNEIFTAFWQMAISTLRQQPMDTSISFYVKHSHQGGGFRYFILHSDVIQAQNSHFC